MSTASTDHCRPRFRHFTATIRDTLLMRYEGFGFTVEGVLNALERHLQEAPPDDGKYPACVALWEGEHLVGFVTVTPMRPTEYSRKDHNAKAFQLRDDAGGHTYYWKEDEEGDVRLQVGRPGDKSTDNDED